MKDRDTVIRREPERKLTSSPDDAVTQYGRVLRVTAELRSGDIARVLVRWPRGFIVWHLADELEVVTC